MYHNRTKMYPTNVDSLEEQPSTVENPQDSRIENSNKAEAVECEGKETTAIRPLR